MTWFGLCWRGVLMGCVEVLPGISGGTIALLTRIYDKLVNSLSQLGHFRNADRNRAELICALKFLLQLGLWMACGFAIALLTVVEIVEREPNLFWGAVFGIVVGAVVQLVRTVTRRDLLRFAPFGLLVGLLIVALPGWSFEPPLWLYALGGVGAFCAWLLPGVSGSMVLLLMGLWMPMLEAVKHVELTKLALFGGGMILALVVVPKIIAVGIRHHQRVVHAFFVGLIASTLYRAWPWQSNSHFPALPTMSEDHQLFAVVGCALLGCAVVVVSMRVAGRNAA